MNLCNTYGTSIEELSPKKIGEQSKFLTFTEPTSLFPPTSSPTTGTARIRQATHKHRHAGERRAHGDAGHVQAQVLPGDLDATGAREQGELHASSLKVGGCGAVCAHDTLGEKKDKNTLHQKARQTNGHAFSKHGT